jgi:hypothetical protein
MHSDTFDPKQSVEIFRDGIHKNVHNSLPQDSGKLLLWNNLL